MIAIKTPAAAGLSPLIAGIRTAVDSHAGWAETAQLVADQLRRHLPTPDLLIAEQRLGSPDDYCAYNLSVEPDGAVLRHATHPGCSSLFAAGATGVRAHRRGEWVSPRSPRARGAQG